ncbi:hypothetical protein [Parasitella parasitica]|uniref:Tc1-like transposase DDE domain-containing protein n=1 Tax=Parasitella parasitica TaxID=35722 RepID=A0A0B7NUP3_9FUNG|nr:hypothetical protein [Parasitella parasitica]
MDYLNNCVFENKSGFDINMRRSRGWSPRGSQAITTTPSIKATSHSVLGAISAAGVVNVKLRESGNIKGRKVVGATKRKAPEYQLSVLKGTTGEHYLQFINDTMDIMDEFPEMKGYFIIMDNAPIHVPEMIDPIIMKRGYTPVYLPPYSPELNPSDVETLIARPVKQCQLFNFKTLFNIHTSANKTQKTGLTKKAFLEIVKSKHLTPVFVTYDIARKYNHKLLFTPPYHCELQPIEKIWSIVKNPIAFYPDLHETAKSLKEKLEAALKNIKEEYFISVWKKCLEVSKQYQDGYVKKNCIEEHQKETEDVEMTSC